MKQPKRNGRTPLGTVEYTERGFEFINFRDRYDMPCSLQQSSLAEYEQPGCSAVWLGREITPSQKDDITNTRMHLDLRQVRALVCVLEQWAENGTFLGDDDPDFQKRRIK